MMRSDGELVATALLAQADYLRREARAAACLTPCERRRQLVTTLREEATRCDVLAHDAIRADVRRNRAVVGARAKADT